jgi:hypothetical protein
LCSPDKEIFEYIQAYLNIFEVFLKNIQMNVQYAWFAPGIMDKTACPPLRLPVSLRTPNMTTLYSPLKRRSVVFMEAYVYIMEKVVIRPTNAQRSNIAILSK